MNMTTPTQTSISPRATAPSEHERSTWQDDHSFRVWFRQINEHVSPVAWVCVASFHFLDDALNYIASCQDKGVDVVYQSPAYVMPVKATDDRVVWKAK